MLSVAARFGPHTLVIGLIIGFTLPELAGFLLPYLPQMVAMLLFLAALQIAPRDIGGSLKDAPRTIGYIAALQLATPVLVLGAGLVSGTTQSPVFLALFLMTSAPSIAGSPNMALMLGRTPAPALRLLILGTALAPVSVVLLFPFVPALGEGSEIAVTAAKLAGIILGATFCAALVRVTVLRAPSRAAKTRLRGASNIMLAVFTVGLMAPLRDLVLSDPSSAIMWFTLACGANFGLQTLAWIIAKNAPADTRLAISLISGNRNFALFFISLTPEASALGNRP